MTTRTLLITIDGDDNRKACGGCPFVVQDVGHWRTHEPQCKAPFPGWAGRAIGKPEMRHEACLDAERAAKNANDALVLAAIRAGRTTPIPPGGDRPDPEDAP